MKSGGSMAIRLKPGYVVRPRGGDYELTVAKVSGSKQVLCVRLANGKLETRCFDPSTLELVWSQEPPQAALKPGDVVQLPSGEALEYMTVEECRGNQVRCLWFSAAGFATHWLAANILWVIKPTHDATAQVDKGDAVWLRSGGPRMTVEQGGTSKVRCACATGETVWLDARTLKIDGFEAGERISQKLMTFARDQGVDLAALCVGPESGSAYFFCDGRSINFWRKTRNGVIYYGIQGPIKLLPEEFKASASAFCGFWHESGYFPSIEKTFAFVKAWLIDRCEVDELPKRKRLRYGIG